MLLMNLPSKEKQKITEIKNYLQIISSPLHPVRLIHYCYLLSVFCNFLPRKWYYYLKSDNDGNKWYALTGRKCALLKGD